LKTETKLNEALKFARLYRGAVVVIITQFGKLEKPLTANSGKITNLRVYDVSKIQLTNYDIVSDPNSPYFEDVEAFKIRLENGDLMEVHRSRCLCFKGEMTSKNRNRLDLTYRFWGVSILQKVYDQLSWYGVAEQGVANLIQESSVGKFKLSNLPKMLAQNNGAALVIDRIEIMNMSKSILNAILIGPDEDYTRDSINFAGVPEIMDKMMINLSAVAKIPVAILFGRDSSGGLNNDGSAEFRKHYDKISTKQTKELLPELQYLVDYIVGYIFPNSNEKHNVVFNSLWEPTQKEQAEIEKINSETDVNYVNTGVFIPDDILEMRFPGYAKEAE